MDNSMLYAAIPVFALKAFGSTQSVVSSAQQHEACAIRGTVVGSDSHNPVPLASVVLVTESMNSGGPAERASGNQQTAAADDRGTFVFGDLEPAVYRVSAPPGPYSSQYLPLKSADGMRVDPTQCQGIASVEVPLPEGAVITGRVTDGHGTPLVREHVSAIEVPRAKNADVQSPIMIDTDDSGQYRFFGPAPGRYVIDASPTRRNRDASGPAGYIRTFYPGTADEASARLIQVDAAQQVSAIDIQFVQSSVGVIDGQVTDSSGVRRFGCVIIPATRGAVAMSDSQGRFASPKS